MIFFLVLFSTNMYTIASGQVTTVPIKLVTVVWAPHFFAFLAQQKNLFEKNHVNVQMVPDYIQAVKSYEDGDFDGIFEVYSAKSGNRYQSCV
jgi:ABC-type nitrate/sulfonate/bicarbonate transport system substrate-binding protein